jgi:cation transport ATPase
MTGDPIRFLAVMVIATPCPLLIAIPIAIIGSISLCARRAIIIKSPVVLEQIAECRTAIFDKTGTLTYGEPTLTEQVIAPGFSQPDVLTLVASLERYSKHPLARAILASATAAGVQIPEATEVSEPPGQGLRGTVAGHQVQVTSRNKLMARPVTRPIPVIATRSRFMSQPAGWPLPDGRPRTTVRSRRVEPRALHAACRTPRSSAAGTGREG